MRSRSRSPDRRHHSDRRGDGFSDERHRRRSPDHRSSRHRDAKHHQHSPGGDASRKRSRRSRSRSPHGSHERRDEPPNKRVDLRPATLSDNPPAVRSIFRATVHSIRAFGIFVSLPGYRRDGMVHISQVSDELTLSREDDDADKIRAMEYFAPAGSQVWVKVVEVQEEADGRVKVGCSMRVVDQEDGTDLDPNNELARKGHGQRQTEVLSDEPLEVGQVMRATVQSIKPYGIFVKIQGHRNNGLVHLSQVSEHLELGREDTDEEKVAALSEVHAVGDEVFAKIVEIKEDDGSGRGPKISCSIKLANQRDGTDLDPHNMKYQPHGGGGQYGGPQRIGQRAGELAAGGKVEWGHLKAGDSQYKQSEQQYDLLEEDPELDAPEAARNALPGPPPGPPPEARGRGRGAVLPAWLTSGQAPGKPAGEQEAAGVASITDIQQALAIVEKYGKKQKKSKKEKKEKKQKKGKDKKDKDKKEKKKSRKKQESDSD